MSLGGLKKPWKTIYVATWLFALALVTWTLLQLPLAEMAARIGRLTASDYLRWAAINCLVLYLLIKRWQVLADSLDAPLTPGFLFRLRQSGSTINFVTPGPHLGGEPLQIYWLHRYCSLSMHRAVAVLGLDRFMETGTNTAVLLAGVLILLGSSVAPIADWLEISALLAAVLVLLSIGSAMILRHPDWLAARFRRLAQSWMTSGRLERSERGWVALVELLRNAFKTRRQQLWLALLLSIAGWGALLLELFVLLSYLEIAPSVFQLITIMVGMRLAMLLPVPGGIGTIEASVLWSFNLLGLPLTAAAGLIALMRLRDAIMLLIGLACLASFQQPLKQAQQ